VRWGRSSMKKQKICIVAPVHKYDDVRVFQKEAVTLSKYYQVVLFSKINLAKQISPNLIVKPVGVYNKV